MKNFLKVLGIIAGAVVLIIILAVVFTSGLSKVANTMFYDLKAGNVEQAYATTAEQFKASTTLPQFESFVYETKLYTYKSVTRTEREVINNQGFLKGTVILADGSKLPIEMDLIKEDGEWKIWSIYIPQGGLIEQEQTSYETTQGDPIIHPLPSDGEIDMLVQNAIMVFAEAINKKDLTLFYNTVSLFRQEQTTPQKLQEAFQPFIDNQKDFSSLFGVQPQHSALPEIDNNGLLVIKGWIPFEETAVIFEQKYYNENGEWKLFGFYLQIA